MKFLVISLSFWNHCVMYVIWRYWSMAELACTFLLTIEAVNDGLVYAHISSMHHIRVLQMLLGLSR